MKFSKIVACGEALQEALIKEPTTMVSSVFGEITAISCSYSSRYHADKTDNAICGKMNILSYSTGMATPIRITVAFKEVKLKISAADSECLEVRLEMADSFIKQYQYWTRDNPMKGVEIKDVKMEDIISSPQVLLYFLDHSEAVTNAIKTVVKDYPEKLESN